MEILQPVRTPAEFRKAFDNGGYFWNLFSHSGDGVITKSEIAKAAQTLAADRTAILRLELLRGFLPTAQAKVALASLDKTALARWKKHEPTRCTALDALALPAGTGVIVEAVPQPANDAEGEGLTYTWMMMVGGAVIPVVSPMSGHFRLWRLDDGKKSRPPTLLAATPKSLDLGGRRLVIGALVHESPGKAPAGEAKSRCLMGIAACPA